jgi:hypothetical protein
MTPRDPSATAERHTVSLDGHESYAHSAIGYTGEDWTVAARLWDVPRHLARGLLCRYARGDSVEALRDYFHDAYLPALQRAGQRWDGLGQGKRLALHFDQTASWMLLFALVCFDEDGSQLRRLDHWFTPDCHPVLYQMVLQGFVPGHAYDELFDRDIHAIAHEDPVTSALLQAPGAWPLAFGAFMRHWPQLMERHGYREHVDADAYPFNEFPLHLGVAVCAFDIDDAAFRHLPFYPADLVAYYREHVRYKRDAWRTTIIEPGIGLPESARPQLKQTHTLSPALTKSQAYTRWMELVCGPQPGRAEQVRKALGSRKTMPDRWQLMEVLAGQGLAIQADIKDDDTAHAFMLDLCRSWQLPAPQLPASPPQGPARISALLTVLHAHARQHAHRLAVLDNGDDSWNAVLYDATFEAEFAALCEKLDIEVMDEGAWD